MSQSEDNILDLQHKMFTVFIQAISKENHPDLKRFEFRVSFSGCVRDETAVLCDFLIQEIPREKKI